MLYKVFAYRDPLHKLSGSRGDLIGRISVVSDIRRSLWADQKLFFKHQRMDDDLVHFPEWEQYLQTWELGRLDEVGLTLPMPTEKCPFKFLYDMWDHFTEDVTNEVAEPLLGEVAVELI